MSTIQLPVQGKNGGGLFFTIDAEDYEKVKGYVWTLGFNSNKREDGTVGYRRYYIKTHVDGKTIRLHRFLLDVTISTVDVDHIDDDFLNNSKSNLVALPHNLHSKKSAAKRKQLAKERKCAGGQATSISGIAM